LRAEGGAGNAKTCQVALDNGGNAVVVWSQQNQDSGIYARRFSAGAWGPVTPLGTSKDGLCSPHVAMNNDGQIMVIWYGSPNIFAKRFSSGSWGTTNELVTINGHPSVSLVAMDDNGTAMAIFRDHDQANALGHIYAYQFSPGGWSTSTAISKKADRFGSFQVAVDNSGNALAVWQQTNGQVSNSYINRYSAGASPAASSSSSSAPGMSAASSHALGMVSGQEMIPQ